MATSLRDVRVGETVTGLRVAVVDVWEGGSYLVGDSSASLKLVVGKDFRAFQKYETLVVDVEVQKSSLRLLRERPASDGPLVAMESCGVIVFAKDTKRFLAIRDYHTKVFIDVQFKLRAAFDQRILSLPVDAMVAHITEWSNTELSWIVEWKLTSVWPYLTPDRIKQWNPVMKRMDNDIKLLYRACKNELQRRQQAAGACDVVNTSWGFPKGGCKFVRSRVELPEEVAMRELTEETGLTAPIESLRQFFDIRRPHGHTFDRWFVYVVPESRPMDKPDSAWDVACLEWVSLETLPPSLERFRESLATLIAGPSAANTPSVSAQTPTAGDVLSPMPSAYTGISAAPTPTADGPAAASVHAADAVT